MLIKTSELEGLALDWAVAKCKYPKLVWGETIGIHHASFQIVIPEFKSPHCYWSPSTDWEQGGPMIAKMIQEQGLVLQKFGDQVSASVDNPHRLFSGKTPLIAAMRCYVASTIGLEVDVPDELIVAPAVNDGLSM